MNIQETLRQGSGQKKQPLDEPEQRWPAIVALLCIGGLNLALPKSLTVGPLWLPLALVVILLVPTVLTYRAGNERLNHFFGHCVAGVVTISLAISVFLLVKALPAHTEAAVQLLKSAILLWITNVLVFASWYWRLDAGGPHMRDKTPGHEDGAFLFPQMTMQQADGGKEYEDGTLWSPQFIDYLFLAFNTSTALSPADTAVLSRWAKVLVMVQASISLTIIVLLASRAVNIL